MTATGLLLCLSLTSWAKTTVDGDARVGGKLGVGTANPGATMEVQASSATETALQVSGVDETPFVLIDKTGKVALATSPIANLDAFGFDLGSGTALELYAGNLSPSSSALQIAFGYANGSSYRHAIRTRHANSVADNSMDFLVWTSSVATGDLPATEVLSLVTVSSGAMVHVRPAGTPDVELEVSNGTTLGGGTVHRAAEATHSSARLKRDIQELGIAAQRAALAEVSGLRHAAFRYRGEGPESPLRVGLIFEDAPASIQGAGHAVMLDERVTNLELALKELMGRLDGIGAETARERR